MSPITNRAEAKEAGWAQIRESIQSFEGDVINLKKSGEELKDKDTGFGMWGGQLIGQDGKPRPAREFFQISCANIKVTGVSEPLSMDIDGGEFSFRVNTSDFKGSFWIEDFLLSADTNKILIPDGLAGKRIAFKKVTREAKGAKTGVVNPQYNVTNFIIDKIVGNVTGTAQPAQSTTAVTPTPAATKDPLALALDLAVGKTETQFRSAVAIHPDLAPLSALAKAGVLTETLVKEGKLKRVKQGNTEIYQKA